MTTCADALEEAVRHYGGIVSSHQIFDYIKKKYPSIWKESTIRAHIIGCTVNHSSSHHYRHFRKFLYSAASGQVRLYDSYSDGKWVWSPTGMIKLEGNNTEAPIVKENLDEEGDSPKVDSNQISISMEQDLELFLYNDIRVIDPSLDLPEELENRQYNVTSGRIDILAKDNDGSYVVIELKAGTAKDSVLTQLLSYMTDIKSQFNNERVKGIIVAHDFSDKLVKASKLVPGISLKRYNVSFSFEDI